MLKVPAEGVDVVGMKITFRRPVPVIVEETTYYRVFSWLDDNGCLRRESRRRVIIRDTDGVLRRAYVREP